MTNNIPSQRLEANFGNKNPSINVPFHRGYTSHSPGTLLYQAAILFGYRGNQVTCKRATKAILKMGIGGAYRNSFKMAVYLCSSVVWSFPAEVGWTHIPRRCSKNSWSWTGWRWIAWSREESGSREVNSSGRNPAVRKLRKWSEFSIYWRASFVLSVNLTPKMTFSIFFPFKTAKRSLLTSPLLQKTRGSCALRHPHPRLFPSNGTSVSFPYPTSLLHPN